MGGNQNRKDVQMGGRGTQLYGRKLIYGTQMGVIFIVYGTQLYGNATQSYIQKGIRVHPNKGICDTDAYLAMFHRKILHPIGWQ